MRHRFREWSSAQWSAGGIRLLGVLLVIVACGLGFVVLADEIMEHETQGFDEAVVRAMRRADDPSMPIGPVWLQGAARDVTALGGVTVLTLVTLVVCGFLALVRHFRSLLLVLGSTVSGAVLNTVLKEFFARPRPTVVPHLTEAFAASFPSGHAMLSAIVYLTLGALLAQLTESRWVKAYVLGVSLAADLPRGADARLPGGALPHGRARRMDGGPGLGAPQLAACWSGEAAQPGPARGGAHGCGGARSTS